MTVLEEAGFFGGQSLAERIRLESAEDENTLTLKDGSLASIIQIDGSLRHENHEELAAVANALRVSLAPQLSSPGHAAEFIFSRDPAAARRHVEQIVGRQRRRAEELELDFSDILEGAETRLSGSLVGESCLAVIYTRPSADIAGELGVSANRRPEERLLEGPARNAEMSDVSARHVTLTDALCRDLRSRGRVARILGIVDALREIRASLYPFSAPWKSEWTPVLPLHLRGGRPARFAAMPATEGQLGCRDFSNLGPPPFDHQLAVEDAQILGARTVRIGDTVFSGFDVTVAPEILTPFDDLVAETMASPVPLSWRCRFLIEPGGLQSVRLKEQFSRLFAFAAPVRNTRIRDSIAALRGIDGAGDTVVRLRISFAVWTRAAEEADLRRKLAILQRAAEQWGNLSTDGVSADPLSTVLSTSAGLGPASTAPAAAAPLSDALAMLPISRQASPWPEGPVTFRTRDGKVWPYWPGSSRQNSWVEIYSGTPGSGKSVAMHAVNRSCVTAPHAADSDSAELPRVAVLDIGRSSKGFVDLVREALPAHRRQEAVHLKLRMTPDHAINPFDTPLGMRRPLAAGRSFMVNFLGVLCGAAESSAGCPVAGLAGASLDQAYETLSDARNPKRYIEGDIPEVDRVLAETGSVPGSGSTWWQVTDTLFSAGLAGAAAKAQTRAVPVLSDLVAASHAEHVVSLYAEAQAEMSGEPVIKAFHRRIAEAIREFRIMAAPTRFDAGPARIAALDLEEVAGAHSGAGALRQTSLMYMLARQAMIGGWLIDENEISKAVSSGFCPPGYRDFHTRRARTNRSIPKLLCVDEFHRTGGLTGFKRQILQDIREGRKNNVRIALASQLPGDFGADILDVASTLLIFDAPSETSAGMLAERLGLSDAEKHILRHRLNGPTEGGAPFFAFIRHKNGTARQLLYLTLGSPELWALSTTPEDTELRDSLAAALGAKEARRALSARFPGGSAKSEIENRAARQTELRGDAPLQGVIEGLAHELASSFRA